MIKSSITNESEHMGSILGYQSEHCKILNIQAPIDNNESIGDMNLVSRKNNLSKLITIRQIRLTSNINDDKGIATTNLLAKRNKYRAVRHELLSPPRLSNVVQVLTNYIPKKPNQTTPYVPVGMQNI